MSDRAASVSRVGFDVINEGGATGVWFLIAGVAIGTKNETKITKRVKWRLKHEE
jgi:hypothetical protein